MSDRSRLRLGVLQLLVLSLVATLFGRLWYLQVLAGAQYERIAADNGRGTIVEAATRGRILDDLGRELVTNRTSLVVSISYAQLSTQKDKGAAMLKRLSALIKVPADELAMQVKPCESAAERRRKHITVCNNGSPLQPVPVAKDVPPEVAFRIMEHREDFPGVEAKAVAVRAYPRRTLAAHVFGYLGRISADEVGKGRYKNGYDASDLVGRGGVEEVYDRDLKGVSGLQTVAVNRLGRVTGVVETQEAVPGNDLVLSLDTGVQQAAEKALADWMAYARRRPPDTHGRLSPAPSGAAVVVDVTNGRVVALASNPTFDPAAFGVPIPKKDYERLFGEQAGDPLVSRAVQGRFAPGSTFKLVSTAAAVEGGLAPLGGSYSCPGKLKVGNSYKSNFEGRGEGTISLYTTLVKSCDTVYYQFAINEWFRDNGLVEQKRKPVEALQAMAREFGFGRRTGIDLPDERAGVIMDRELRRRTWEENKEQYCKDAQNPAYSDYVRAISQENCKEGYAYRLGDEANHYVGQGEVLVTPLQMAMAYAALANGGTVYEPRIAKAVIGPDGKVVRRIDPKPLRKVKVSPQTLAYINNALAAVPTDGTAKGAFAGFPYGTLPVAGKTGTAEVVGKQNTSWFASYGPVGHPRYAVVVMVEQAGQGGQVAAPAVRQIWDGIYGLEGHKAAYPGGVPPVALPKVAADGTVSAPPAPRPAPASPAPSAVASAVALPEPLPRRRGAVA
ncbi:MAG TPA: penicillin-binding protein 2 [Mycobacteriales bacterium]|jgi:penicillin-binding protein 2|nr:penicillin-binding protein 2 [Mycobacteriales bacterium]